MHTGAIKKWALALTLWVALHTSSLRAQIFTAPLQASTTGTNPVDFEFRADGTLIAKGNAGVGSLLTDDQGAGVRMLWFPSLGAFRAGGVDWVQWDASNIGQYSAAMGWDTTSSGYGSMAFGVLSTASGYRSVILGSGNTANATGSAIVGSENTASGLNSMTLGTGNTASGWYALALGQSNSSTGRTSTTMGGGNTASGWYSTASGLYTTASSYFSFVVGTFNVGGGSDSTWVPTDPLFEVGNGGGSGYGNPNASGPSDAFVVYKNGNATLQGTLHVSPSGDIPMFSGN